MTSFAKVRKILEGELGYRESGNNHQKYSPNVPGLEWSQNQPWCATFNAWVFMKAGLRPNVDYPVTASCLAGVAWYRSRGRWSNTPRAGDQVFYGTNGGTHVEIVIDVSSGYITTIGGNTSGSLGGNYFNGDGVYKKNVDRNSSRIYGYGRPVFTNTTEEEDDMPDIYVSLGSDWVGNLGKGEWCNLGWNKEYGDSSHQHGGPGVYPTVLVTPSRYIATVQVSIEGMGPKDRGWIRAAEAEKTSNGKFRYVEFNGTDTITGTADGSTVWKHITWTDWLGKGRRLRIQAGSFTCPVKVLPYSCKINAWKA